jgi:intein-encoded DNA endonuclease-like protein
MESNRLVIRIDPKEKKALKKQASKYGDSLTAYVKRKLFDENEDLAESDIYISPKSNKSDLVMVSVLHKSLHFMREVLKKLGTSEEEIIAAEKRSIEYARQERERYGYRLIKAQDE